MSEQELEAQLIESMHKLNKAGDKIAQTNGYTEDAKKIRLLVELIKEQIKNENSLSSARAVR